jgi:hypothetical protein
MPKLERSKFRTELFFCDLWFSRRWNFRLWSSGLGHPVVLAAYIFYLEDKGECSSETLVTIFWLRVVITQTIITWTYL